MYQSKKSAMAECENCGAPLPTPDDRGVQKCSFCQAVHHSPVAKPDPAPITINVSTSSMNVPRTAKKAGAGCGVMGLVITAIVLLAIGVPVYIGIKGAVDAVGGIAGLAGGGRGDHDFGSGFRVLPGEPSAPSLVAMSSRYENGGTVARLVRFDSGRAEPAWTSNQVADNADAAVLTDATRAYVVKNELVALNLTDGKETWRVKLSDDHRADGDCVDCFTLAGDLVLVRTVDGTLHALDAATGAARWTRPFTSVRARVMRVGGHIVALDDAGPGKSKLATLDLATGQDAVTLPVKCQGRGQSWINELNTSTILRPSPAGDSLLAFFSSSGHCAQGWDVATGAQQWNVFTDVSYLDSSKFQVLDSPHGLVVVSRGAVGIIDPARTAFRKVVENEDKWLSGLGLHGNLLVAEQTTTRGTQKHSVVALDLGSGEQRWEHSTGKAQPVGPPSGSPHYNTSADGTYIANVSAGRVLMATFVDGSSTTHTLIMQSLDATTGVPSPPVTMDSGSGSLIPSFGPDHWSGDRVVVRVGDDTIQVLDVAKGTVVTKVS